MAEYFPLISRAVAGLRNGTPEARAAIYDRAKQALLGQLRAIQPPVPEEDIVREAAALDDAVARVEAEVASHKPGPSSAPAKTSGGAVSSKTAQPPPVKPTAPVVSGAPTLGGMQRADAPAVTARPLPPLRPSAFRSSHAADGAENKRPISSGAPVPPAAPDVPPQPPGEASPLPVAPTLQVMADDAPAAASGKGLLLRPSAADTELKIEADGSEAQGRPADDGVRPAAPRPFESRRPDLRVFIVAFAALMAVVAVAFTAWKLRDKPEELTRTPSVVKTAEPAAGKIVERADGTPTPDTSAASAPAGTAQSPIQNDVDDTPADASRASNQAEAPAINTTVSAAAPATGSAPAAGVDQSVAVAYKAAILVDAPDEPQKVKTFVGTVVWRTETVNPGQDQPIGTAIRGEIDVPDAKVQLVFEMRRNTEPSFPASHTIELKFTAAVDGPVGDIKQIDIPQMRREDMPTGDPMAGVPVTITDDYFLVGLTRGGAEQSNIEMIRSRNWFDIPLLLANKKAAKITFEKGTSGERIFNEVLQSWASAN